MAKRAKKAGGGTAVAEKPPERPRPILGVDIKGELRDVELSHVIEPDGAADRLARPGDDAAIEQLARSMGECGQLQPVMLEELSGGKYRRVFGRRRIAAARKLAWPTIRGSIVQPLPDNVRRTIVAVENVQRQDLTPAEETLAVDELMLLQALSAAKQLRKPLLEGCGALAGKTIDSDFNFDGGIAENRDLSAAALSHDMLLDHRVRGIASELVAAMLGKPATWVRDRLYIGRLSDKSKGLVLEGKLPLAHAREISKVADEKRRDELVKAYAAGGDDSISDTEAGPLEDLQDEVRRSVFSLHVVPWRPSEAFAGKRPCDGCPSNSATHPGLFEGGGQVSLQMIGGRGTYGGAEANSAKVAAAGICTLPSCYADKLRAAKGAISAAAKRIVDGGKRTGDAKVAAYVLPSALEAKVKDRRKRMGSAKSRARAEKATAPTAAQKATRARVEAQDKLGDALRKECRDIEPKIAAALAKTKGAWVIYHLIRETKLFQSAHGGDDKKTARVVAGAEMSSMLKLLAKPDWDGVVKLEKQCGTRYGLLDQWYDGPSGLARKIAQALGIELDAAPTLEDFLPKAADKKAAAEARQ